MRDSNLKIPDIKAFRAVTRFLGLLGISECRTFHPPPPHPWQNSPKHISWTYGLGLAEAKSLVERMWDYRVTSNGPLDQLQKGNELHEIKRTRQLMSTLNKLGLKAPDAGLQICRQFVTRMRRR